MRPAEDVATIAIVDDHEAVQRSISRLLKSAGYECAAYESAEAFLDACRSQRPDCALVDFRLPGLNGLDLQCRLHEMGNSIPIIVVSAYNDRVRAQALEPGPVAVPGKPFRRGRQARRHPIRSQALGQRIRPQRILNGDGGTRNASGCREALDSRQ
jgi:FixJ family two-component response regulator